MLYGKVGLWAARARHRRRARRAPPGKPSIGCPTCRQNTTRKGLFFEKQASKSKKKHRVNVRCGKINSVKIITLKFFFERNTIIPQKNRNIANQF